MACLMRADNMPNMGLAVRLIRHNAGGQQFDIAATDTNICPAILAQCLAGLRADRIGMIVQSAIASGGGVAASARTPLALVKAIALGAAWGKIRRGDMGNMGQGRQHNIMAFASRQRSQLAGIRLRSGDQKPHHAAPLGIKWGARAFMSCASVAPNCAASVASIGQ